MSDPSADIAKVLISEEEIRRRVGELAAQVQSDFAGRDLVVVGLLTGTLMFLADLVREIDLPLRLDFIGVSSYRDGTESRELVFTKELKLDVANRDVLLVDDILDELRKRDVPNSDVRHWHRVDPHTLRDVARHLLKRLW